MREPAWRFGALSLLRLDGRLQSGQQIHRGLFGRRLLDLDNLLSLDLLFDQFLQP